MKKHIPNMITCGNLISGCCATGAAFNGNFDWAVYMIILGAVFDFFDGMVARLLGVSSPIGKELDSLADVVTFGVAPSALLFHMIGYAVTVGHVLSFTPDVVAGYLPYLAFVMAAFSGLRLAKFNLDTRQTTSFIGLPTPANALFWCSLAMSRYYAAFSSTTLLLLMLGMSLLLVAEIPLFALKFKNLSWKDNYIKYIFLVGCAVLILFLGKACFAGIVIWYVFLSVIENKFIKRN